MKLLKPFLFDLVFLLCKRNLKFLGYSVILTLTLGSAFALSINNTLPTEINTYDLTISDYVTCNNVTNCNITFPKENITLDLPYSDILGFNYSGFNFSFTSTAPDGIVFAESHFWITDTTTDRVYKYTANGTYTGTSFDVSSQATRPTAITYDGSELWVVDRDSDFVYEYTTSGTYTGTSFDVSSQSGLMEGILFKDNQFYINSNTDVYIYNSAGVYSGTSYSLGSGYHNGITSIEDKFYITDAIDEIVEIYSSSFVYESNFSTSSQDGSIQDITNFNDSLYVIGSQFDSIYKYDNLGTINKNYTFTFNGNQSYIISATNGTSTITENGTILVNPNQYFYFYDLEDSTFISNYTFGNKSFTGTKANFTLYELGLGTHSLDFEKSGFVTSTFNVTFTNTSEINQTFNVEKARILFKVYDQVTNSLLDNRTLDLEIIGDVSLVANSTNGIFNLTSLVTPGTYQAKISTTDYISTEKTFEFDAKSLYESNFYLIPTNYSLAGFVIVITYNADNTFAASVPVTANQWDSSTSTFIETFRTTSNTNGRAVMPIILEDELYKFCAEYDTGTVCFPEGNLGQSFSRTQNGEEIPLLQNVNFPIIDVTQFDNLQFNLLYSNLTNFSTSSYLYEVGYSWNTKDGTDATVCAKLVKDFNFTETEVSPINCSTTNSGSFFQNYIINNSFNYKFTVYQDKSDGSEEILYTDHIGGQNTVLGFLESFNLGMFTKVLIIILMVGAIPFLKYPFLIVFDVMLVMFFSWRWIIPQELSITTVGVFIVLGILTLWAVSKK